MLRLSIICLALAYSLLQSEAVPKGRFFEAENEDLSQLRSQFEKFKETYNKNYEGYEDEERFNIFVKNLKKAKEAQEQDRGTAEYGITKFSDMSDEEFDGFYLNPELSNASSWPKEAFWQEESTPMTNLSCPTSFDWRSHGAVTKVKDQKKEKCKSDWAFATIANIESMWFIRRGELMVLSEQELLDCDTWDQNCEEGKPSKAFNAIMKLGGVMMSEKYPYIASKGSCKNVSSMTVAEIVSTEIISTDEKEMSAWLAQNGPIVVTINSAAMKGYQGGIARPTIYECHPEALDHSMLIVGYGTLAGWPYWIMKNSWGADWGEGGYFRIYRGDGSCGLNKFPISSIVS